MSKTKKWILAVVVVLVWGAPFMEIAVFNGLFGTLRGRGLFGRLLTVKLTREDAFVRHYLDEVRRGDIQSTTELAEEDIRTPDFRSAILGIDGFEDRSCQRTGREGG